MAIRVYVAAKLPQTALSAEEVIPEFIDDVPTDVLQWARTASTQGPKVDGCKVGVIANAQLIMTGPTATHMELTSNSHGLFDNAIIRIRGDASIIHEEEVPRAGVTVTRQFQRARGSNGEVFTWVGRRKVTGRGEGASGLAFDQISPLTQPESS